LLHTAIGGYGYFTSLVNNAETVSEASSSSSSSGSGESLAMEEAARHVGDLSFSWHVIANVIAQALIFVSSCCNPFIYYISSKNFRESLYSTVCMRSQTAAIVVLDE